MLHPICDHTCRRTGAVFGELVPHGLDATSARGLLRLLEELRRGGLTVVVISHDFAGMEELCPRTLHLRDGVLVPVPTGATS